MSTGQFFTEIQLNKHHSTLIVGANGAGKSTILDALSFVLYGKPYRKINKPQLVNSINKKDLLVEVEFTIGESQYLIRRGIKPTVFEVIKNGVLINQNAESRDYQEVLEKQILKINHKAFCQVVVIGSAGFVPFMELTSANRREIIEDILDLQIFTRMNLLLKEQIQINKDAFNDVESQLKVVRELVSIHQKYERNLAQNNQKMLDEKKERIEDTKTLVVGAKQAIVDINTKLEEMMLSIADFQSVKTKHEKMLLLKNQIGVKAKAVKEDISFYDTSDNCPTCKQKIALDFKTQTIDEKKKTLLSLQSAAEQLQEKLDVTLERLEKIDKIQSSKYDLNINLNIEETKIKNWEDFIRTTQKEIETIGEDVVLKSDDAQYMIQKDKLAELEKQYNEISQESDVLIAASLILKDGGIKASIIKQYIPVINKIINKYLSALDFFINFQLNEQFEETIKARFRDDFSYASFSEGEKMRINIALLFAWRSVAKLRNSISTNLLIMDEIFDSSLDDIGKEDFIKILEAAKENNTFIISHVTEGFYDKFENVILFQKHKNFSNIKVEND